MSRAKSKCRVQNAKCKMASRSRETARGNDKFAGCSLQCPEPQVWDLVLGIWSFRRVAAVWLDFRAMGAKMDAEVTVE